MTKVSAYMVKRGMEQVLAASKSSLISSLDFSGPQAPVADYVQSRNQIQIFPQGG